MRGLGSDHVISGSKKTAYNGAKAQTEPQTDMVTQQNFQVSKFLSFRGSAFPSYRVSKFPIRKFPSEGEREGGPIR